MDMGTRNSIDDKLNRLRKPDSRQGFIYRVHEHLRNVNRKAYEPDILAIGPYHRDKDSCKMMEEHKWRYLQSLLSRTEESTPERYISAIEELEEKARNCYSEPINLSSSEFIELLVLDGCFIIELVQKVTNVVLVNRYDRLSDPIFHTEWIINTLQRDMMLFENQIPYFVLCKLFELIEEADRNEEKFFELIDEEFFELTTDESGQQIEETDQQNIEESGQQIEESDQQIPKRQIDQRNRLLDLLLSLFFRNLLPGAENVLQMSRATETDTRHLLDLIHSCWIPESLRRFLFPTLNKFPGLPGEREWRFINSAAELKDANVKFQKMEYSDRTNLFEVQFQNGTILMPTLIIENRTECLFRNLIVYEQNFPFDRHSYITDYVTFLDRLINSSKDVDILSECGIIDNWLGDKEVIANMFNHITDAIVGHGPSKIDLCLC